MRAIDTVRRRGRAARQRPPERTTLSEIAAAAGVSAMTVSNVVNGKFESMAAETRAQIERLIAEMNYRPHAAGRRLRLNRNNAVGLLVVDASPAFLADPMTSYMIAGLGNHLNRNGFSLTINGVAPGRLEEAVLLGKHDTDALCVLASGSPAERALTLPAMADAGQPLLIVQDRPAEPLADAASIRQDDAGGGRMLARRLLGRGARRFVLLMPTPIWPAFIERERGIAEAVAEVPDASLAVVRTAGEGIDDTQAALADWVACHGVPDAVMGGNDQMGIAALLWLQARGHVVPRDVKVTGFNGFEFRRYAVPILTSVRSSALALGERAGEMLLERVTTGAFRMPEVILPVDLLPGESD